MSKLYKYITSGSFKNQLVVGIVLGILLGLLFTWGLNKGLSKTPTKAPEVLILGASELEIDNFKKENVELQETIDILRSEWKDIIEEVLDERN